MSTPSKRFTNFIGNLPQTTDTQGKTWAEKIGSWFGEALSSGFDVFFKLLGKSFAPKITPLVNTLEATGKVPDELKPLLEEIKRPTGEVAAMIGQSAAHSIVGGAFNKILDAFLLPVAYGAMARFKPVILNPAQYVALFKRGVISHDLYIELMSFHGYTPARAQEWLILFEQVYTLEQAIGLWKRKKITDETLDKTLKILGYTDDKIAGMKELAKVLPNASDIIRFAIREAYTPEIAEKFGQYQDFPEKAMDDADMIGLSRELFSKYWAAHWELPATTQGFDMLHRGIISKDELAILLRALDVMPFWRERLIKLSYNVLTRVDARRMWDMGILNDAELENTYISEGYNPENAHLMSVWTKVYMTYPDLIARYKNGYINLDDCKHELINLGLSETRAIWLIEQKIKKQAPERTSKERDLTKAEIVKGLTKNVINEPTAIELLIDMGYSESEATYILAINAPSEESAKAKSQKELTKSDILSSLKKELITTDDALSRLISIRFLPDDAQFLIDLALATKAPITETKQKEITKADIVAGVKKGLITAEDGYLLLQDIGYSADSANFILALITPATGGSPDSYTEFKKLTQSYRESQGLHSKPISQDLINAERELQAASDTLNYAKAQKADQNKLTALTKAVSDATTRYKQLLEKYKQEK